MQNGLLQASEYEAALSTRFAEYAGHLVAPASQTLGSVVHDIGDASFPLLSCRSGNRDTHLCRTPLFRDEKIMVGERTQHSAYSAIGF